MFSPLVLIPVTLILILLISKTWERWTRKDKSKLLKAPGVGYGYIPLIGKWLGAYTFMKDPRGTLMNGATLYRGQYFRISSHHIEFHLFTTKERLAEYLKAPNDVLSFTDNINEGFQTEWTFGYEVAHQPYHIPLLRTKFTKSIPRKIPVMANKIADSILSLLGNPPEFESIKLYGKIAILIAQISNYVFAGLDLCHDSEYLNLAVGYAQNTVIAAEMLKLFPQRIKPFIARLTPLYNIRRRAGEILGPIIQNRLDGNHGQGPKPNDMLQILIDNSPDDTKVISKIVDYMMMLNLSSIHSTTMTTMNVIAMLIRRPYDVAVLREEINLYCSGNEMNKSVLSKLAKLDSFIRESTRHNPLGLVSTPRTARKNFTFSDGMVIPAGARIGAPIDLFHLHNPDVDNPGAFDGFRYSNMAGKSRGSSRHQAVNTDLNFLTFGHGTHTCPGRFLAVTEIKLILAALISRYDITAAPGTAPKTKYLGVGLVPDMEFQYLVKARS